MAFDFPASPTTGQVSNGYVYDGIGWAGGPGISGPQDEQFFTLDGLTEIIVTTPTWAKGCVIEGSVFMAAASSYVGLTVSFDGTTFQTGYSLGGMNHTTTPSTYSGQAVVAGSWLYLSYPKTNLNIPHTFTGQLNLTSSGTGLAVMRSTWVSYDNTTQVGTSSWTSWTSNQIPAGGRVQKLRIFNPVASAWAGMSWVKIRWLGDSATLPQTNAIADAPADNLLYRRRNNLWVPTQPGEVLGAGGGRHATYASYGGTTTNIVSATYTIKQTGGWLAVIGTIAGAVGSAGASAAAQILVNGGGYGYAYAYGAAVNAYVTPTITCAMAHGLTAGTVVTITLASWVSAGTFYLNGYSGGAAGGMGSGFSFQEIAV